MEDVVAGSGAGLRYFTVPNLNFKEEPAAAAGPRPMVFAKVSASEAHRVIKVWRALWKKDGRALQFQRPEMHR
jgi:hypothetical protein